MKRLPPSASCRSPEQSSAELRMEGDTPSSEGDGDRRLSYADEPILLLSLPSHSPPAAGNTSTVGGRVDTCSGCGGGDEPNASKKRPRPTCLTTSPEAPPPKADGGLGFKDEDSRAGAGEPSAPQILRKRKLPNSLTNPPSTSAEEPAMEVLSDDNSPPMSLLDCIRIITEMLRRDK